MNYDAFISYSHGADGELARDLQRGLERLAKPWYRRRPFLTVFRDETSFAAGADLGARIRTALDDSSHLVLLLSPESAASPWVDEEVKHWLATKSRDDMTVVVTDWGVASVADAPAHSLSAATAMAPNLSGFQWNGADVPPSLRGVFDEPLAVDMRWARGALAAGPLTLDNPDFEDDVAQVAANILHRNKDELIGVLVGMRVRARILTGTILLAIAILALAIAVSVPGWMKARSDVRDARQELAGLLVELDGAREEVAAAQQDVVDAMAAAELAEQARQQAADDLATTQSSLTATEADLLAAQSAFDAADAAAAEARAELATARDNLEATNEALATASDQLATAIDERDVATGERDAAVTAKDEAVADKNQAVTAKDKAVADKKAAENDKLDAEFAAGIADDRADAADALADASEQLARARRLAGDAASLLDAQVDLALLLGMASADEAAKASSAIAAVEDTTAAIDRREAAGRITQSTTSAPPSSPDAARLMINGLFRDSHIEQMVSDGTGYVGYERGGDRVVISGDGYEPRVTSALDMRAPGVRLQTDDSGVRIRAFERGVLVGTRAGEISLWSPDDGRRLVEVALPVDWIWGLAYEPSARLLAAGTLDGNVHVWQFDSAWQAHAVWSGAVRDHCDEADCAVEALAFSPDASTLLAGGRILAGTTDERGALFRSSIVDLRSATDAPWTPVTTGGLDRSYGFIVQDISVAPDCDPAGVCIVALGSNDVSVRVLDLNAGREAACAQRVGPECLDGHDLAVADVAFDSTGRHLVSASEDQTVRLWSVRRSADGSIVLSSDGVLSGHGSPVFRVSYRQDDRAVVSSRTGGPAIVWSVDRAAFDLETTSVEPGSYPRSRLNDVAMLVDGSLVTSDVTGTVRRWIRGNDGSVVGWEDAPSTLQLIEPRTADGGSDEDFALDCGAQEPGAIADLDNAPASPSGTERLVAGSGTDRVGCGVGAVWYWGRVPGTGLSGGARLQLPVAGIPTWVPSVAFDDEGCRAGRRCLLAAVVRSIDRRIDDAARHSSVVIWDVTGSPKVLRTIVLPIEQPNEREGFGGSAVALTSGSWGAAVIVADDLGDLWVYDVDSGRRTYSRVDAHPGSLVQDRIDHLALQPGGDLMAASAGSSVALWRVQASGGAVTLAPAIGRLLSGPVGAVRSVGWSGDGTVLASTGADDHAVHWWYVDDRGRVAGFTDVTSLTRVSWLHTGAVSGLAVAPDGGELVTISQDGRIVVWPLRWSDWVRAACRVADRDLTEAEWERYTGLTSSPPRYCDG